MSNRFYCIFIAAIMWWGFVFCPHAGPKAASTLISEFNDLLGGRTAKIVWQKDAEGWPGLSSGSGPNELMMLDTRDGVVKTFISDNGYMARPTFTWDGERVVFTDILSLTVYVADWDNGTTEIVATGYESGGCWFNDNKHWVLCYPVGNSGLWKINIDDPSEKIKITDVENTWPSISVDGTHVTAQYPSFSNVGILAVATENIIKFTNGDGSCWPTISRDNNYHTMYTVEPHSHFVIVDAEGNLLKNQKVQQADDGEYNCLRWTPDPDIFTFFHDGENMKNPYVERVSDSAYVYINDPAEGSEGNVDVFFYGSTDTRIPNAGYNHTVKRFGAECVLYDIRGRRISSVQRANASLALVTTHGTEIIRTRWSMVQHREP